MKSTRQNGIPLDRHRQSCYYRPASLLIDLFLLSCCGSTNGVPFNSADGLSFHISNNKRLPPPIVYTIAGSDSGGGAGIQADLHAIHGMACHGCSAVTCLTAQNSVGVTGIHAPPLDFLQQQLEALREDLPPRAIKIGMLGTKELALQVGSILKQWTESSSTTRRFFVVVDPVMVSTSGAKLIEDDAIEAMVKHVFPLADILTPNKFEAQALLNRTLEKPEDVEQAARDLLKLGVKSVLIKGGHTLMEGVANGSGPTNGAIETLGFAQDYFLSSQSPRKDGEERLCDGCRGVWIRSPRYDTEHTHGTGCTLSSAIASSLALGHEQRDRNAMDRFGAISAIDALDACCLGKAYVTAGIARGIGIGKGPGPVAHTTFPSTHEHFPIIALDPIKHNPPPFLPLASCTAAADPSRAKPQLGGILPIVDTIEWVERLCLTPGITDIQLRIKDVASDEDSTTTHKRVLDRVKRCQEICQSSGVRLWVNDFWQAAVQAGCFGVHLGQEDLVKCLTSGGLERMREANMALGISTHSFGELAAALGVRPSYISLGPIFETSSKKVAFEPQRLTTITKWRQLIPPDIPLVAIGGIGDSSAAQLVREAGADCVAVIGAATQAENLHLAVSELNNAMGFNS